jgi:hypothetical protein
LSAKRSVVRTIRLSEALDQTLLTDAKEKSMSVNTLVTGVLARYAEWDRLLEKVHNVSFSSSQVKLLFELSSEETLQKLSDSAADRFIDLAKFIIGSSDIRSLLAIFTTIGKNSGMWSLDQKTQGGFLILHFYHDLGIAFSKYLSQGVQGALSKGGGPRPEMEINEHLVMAKIPLPSEFRDKNAENGDIFGPSRDER